MFQFFRRHVFRAKDGMPGVVARPIAMQQAALGFHLVEQRSGGIRGEDVKRGALQAILFDPLRSLGEHVFMVVVEAKHERPVDLDAVIVEQADAAGVVGGLGSLLFCGGEIVVGERFEADEYAHASCQRHLADERRIVGDIDRYGGTPDLYGRLQGLGRRRKGSRAASLDCYR